VPDGVNVVVDGVTVTVTGPMGRLTQRIPRDMIVEQTESVLSVRRPTDSATHRSLHGLTRTLLANMVEGVTKGFQKRLEVVGVGYRASVKGDNLELLLGFSHPVVMQPPEDVSFETPQPQVILIKGIDKQVVGQVAAKVRELRPPEPYKGKGIRYAGEHVQRKVGKRA
jgi:large subunit ribosomal protein L6